MTVHAVRIHEPGSADVLQWETVTVGDPAPDEVRIAHTAVGLNYIDVYHRSGLYPLPAMPATLGLEAAGVVEAVGHAVRDFRPGDRVAYASPPTGAYAEARLISAARVVPIPNGIEDQQAAAMMLKGMTAQYLLRRTYRVQPGDAVLIHAAAGGVGLIACQWAKHLGALVIGTVGTDEKAELALANGCDHAIVYSREDFPRRVRRITDGDGVAVVYDSVGQATLEGSLECLKPLGMMVSFGNASGAIPAIDPSVLAAKGSLFFTRPSFLTYTAAVDDLRASAHELFEVVTAGVVRIAVNQSYPLREAAMAHRDLEARVTTGSTVLLP